MMSDFHWDSSDWPNNHVSFRGVKRGVGGYTTVHAHFSREFRKFTVAASLKTIKV